MSHSTNVPAAAQLAALLVAAATTACASAPVAPAPAVPPAAVHAADAPPPVEREFRGVWVAAVSNIDWPSQPGLPVDSQKAELVRIMDRAQELRLNVVILHVRPAADALYPSPLEPWSEYLTGEQGRAPEPFYDPLAFAVELAHARGLELHAWFNPYRAGHPSARGPMAASHISRANPELVRSYGSYLWMDPGEEAVRRRSVDVVVDVVRRYDVDGVHIDDYFYPYRERGPDGRELDFPDSATYARYRDGGGTLGRSDWRRWNVDTYVAELYAAVKREKPWVKVGISPIGTWRPNVEPQLGGFDAYEQIYADARKWVMDGDLDYLVPQLYWPIARTDVSFPVLLDWWVRQNPLGRGMYAGLIPSNVNVAADPRRGWQPEEIIGQVYITRGRPGADGHVHFPMRALMPDGAFTRIQGADTMAAERIDSIRAMQRRVQARRDTLVTLLRDEAYARPALVPAMPWLDDVPPPAPRAVVSTQPSGTRIVIEPGAGEAVAQWVVQTQSPGGWRTEIVPGSVRTWTVAPAPGSEDVPAAVWVSGVDRVGNQSAPVRAVPATAAAAVGDMPPAVIRHADWHATPPVGHAADGNRRNVPPGSTFAFRDLAIRVDATFVDSAVQVPARTARLTLTRGDATESRNVPAGAAFNWNGYHIAVIAIPAPGELGGGLVALEAATLESLPAVVAGSTVAGGAELRLRVSHDITNVTLHHTGFPEPLRPDEDPALRLRSLQAWGASDRNWWDVPYHFLIDLDGNVYEGRDWRFKGDTNTTYEPGGHLLLSVIGNYEIQEPTQAQIEAIAGLMAWGMDRFNLGPDRIGGHYNYATTSCPGSYFRGLLEDGTFQRMAQARRVSAP